jgi:hypothetical protein
LTIRFITNILLVHFFAFNLFTAPPPVSARKFQNDANHAKKREGARGIEPEPPYDQRFGYQQFDDDYLRCLRFFA